MSSVPKVKNDDLNAEAFQDALQTFEATRGICQRIEKWAMKELADSCTSLPVHDLIQYCEATIQQCHSYLVDKRPLLQSEFMQEQVWRGLGALGFEPNARSNEHDMLLLELLLVECRRRTQEVVDLLDKKIARIPWEQTQRRDQRAEVKAQQSNDYQRFSTAVTAVHSNLIVEGNSPYILEKRVRVAKEVDGQLLPQMLAFGHKLADFSQLEEPSPNNQYPEEKRIQDFMQSFLRMSTDWVECLQSTTDPLNVRSYSNSSDVPYKEFVGVAAGRGSFGVVYKAEIPNTHTVVAIKQLGGIYSSKSQDTVRKELSMLQRCTHPNIVKLLDAYQIDDNPNTFYLVMEPWAPYTLYAFLHQSDSQRHHDSPWFTQSSHRTERHIIRIFHGLADGLSYLHDKSIKHKDVKPENILLFDAGHRGIRPIIADLGISKIFKHGNPTDYNRSTYAYLAPEQVNSTGSTLRSDVWQLGCCFALMLAVSRQGSAGCQQLWNSFENSDKDCSCNIALEASTFMGTFKLLCGHGSMSQLRVYRLIAAMLEIKPELRLDIEMVSSLLADV
ncbi:hypothetical protein VTL71DRAFT_5906 [Oculimacula yallundae]|uniref:non-specific serine/threonine protein kinase n=1 Tax=Oculimacula yallundae TaxID=86028 RepID=A0ABR4BYU0_9HELO